MRRAKDRGLLRCEPRKLRRPVARVDVTAGACVHGLRIDSSCEPLRRVGGTRVAPAQDRCQRPSTLVERKQAVTEARRADRVVRLSGNRLVDRLLHELDHPRRVRLVDVLPPRRLTLLGGRVEDLRADGRRPDVECASTFVTSRTLTAMAVVIASNLRKELSGDPLFDNVSFKVERRDRVALSGPNGAGKTTLLRALVGETSLQGGELAFQKGTRVALHDQRPPLEQRLTLREYVLSGATDLLELERELRRLEQAMADGDHGEATMRRYGEAQARLEHAGGYDWRERATAVLRGLGFHDEHLDRRWRRSPAVS